MAAGVIGGGGAVAIGVGAGVRTGSACGRALVGSSGFLFHTLASFLFLNVLVRHLSHLEGQLLHIERSHVFGGIPRNFYVRLFSYD